MKKLALLGTGKTGSQVMELASEKGFEVSAFNSRNKATAAALSSSDIVMSFLPGDAFLEYREMILEAGKPLVCGSTGFEWSDKIKSELKTRKLSWLYATNFALGMNIVHKMIEELAKARKLFDQYDFKMHEIHHTKKLDAPSGTALTWKKWLADQVEISSERTGDVVGTHTLTLQSAFERITLTHESLDRKIFAEGALWAAQKLLTDKTLIPGLHSFEDLTMKELL